MKGIILAGGSGTRLYPITEATSKQLTAIYDKPMIFYPLSTLMSAGIRDILIITTKEDQEGFKRLLKDGTEFGINIEYMIQPSPDGLVQAFTLGEEFIGSEPVAMVLGDNIFYGAGIVDKLKQAAEDAKNGIATIFGYQVKDPQRFGIMELDYNNKVIGVEEKPTNQKSDYEITGLYFYPKQVCNIAKTIQPSVRGELEITDLNNIYLNQGILKAQLLNDGYIWFDTGTFESMNDASNFVRSTQIQGNRVICSPEVIAYNNNWLTKETLSKRAELLKKNTYGKYLNEILRK
ncbi:MAG: glucose-1-phosphate thymidylyltransferase RfbA [Bacilli bacterium]